MEPIPKGPLDQRSPRVWWLALLLGACLAPASSQAAAPRVPPDLARRAAQEGEVRVLVQLAIESRPEPRLARSARLAQRARIAAAQAALGDELRGASHRVLRAYRTLPFAAISAGPAALERLERSPRVLGVQADRLHRPALDVSVPLVQADQTRALGFDGSGQVVVVIDTGVDGAHPNLAGKVAAEACFAAGDPFGSGDCPDGTPFQVGPGAGVPCTWTDGCFHGTHVAGTAVGDGPFFDGVAPGADTISIQVFTRVDDPLVCGSLPTPCAQAWASDLIAALEHVHDTLSLQHTIASVNMSLAGLNYASQAECDAANPAMKAAIDQLRAGGIASIAAAGNQGVDDQVGEPACISSAVSVSAVNDSDGIPIWANAASFLSLWAPGQSIRAPRWQSIGYVNASGTSMATPHVAGGFAVLRQGAPSAPVDEIVTALQSTGVPIPHPFASTTRIRLREAAGVLFLHCQNGLDDDGDGSVDHPADLGCSHPLEDFSERGPGFVCDDGSDNDFDDLADFPDDPGCATALSPREDPACDDGSDNDGDGGTDHDGDPPDAQCLNQPWRASEWPTSCGIGFELVALLPLLLWARRRAAGVAATGARKYAPPPDGGVPPAA